jgi:hypothetical protein
MPAEKLHLLELLDFEPEQGVIRLRDQRMLLMGAAAMGWLRKELVKTLGTDITRRLLMRFGYADGYHDAISLREHRRWTDPLDELRAGIALHILEGIVHAEPQRLAFDPVRRRFSGTIVWRNSHEGEQHLYHHGRSDIPVCWTLVGYVSGLASACLATDVYFVEDRCAGQGGERCVLEAATPRAGERRPRGSTMISAAPTCVARWTGSARPCPPGAAPAIGPRRRGAPPSARRRSATHVPASSSPAARRCAASSSSRCGWRRSTSPC